MDDLLFYDSPGRLVSAAAIAIVDCIEREVDMELWQGRRLVARADADRNSA